MTSEEIMLRDGFHTDPKENQPIELVAAWLKEIAYQLAVLNESRSGENRDDA